MHHWLMFCERTVICSVGFFVGFFVGLGVGEADTPGVGAVGARVGLKVGALLWPATTHFG